MTDVFGEEGDSVENPIHENTAGSDPEGAGGRALTASPVEQKAAELRALLDVPSWRNHEGEKNWLFNNILPKGDSGMVELANRMINDQGWMMRTFGVNFEELNEASPEFKAELKQLLLGAGRLKTHLHALYESLTGTTFEEFLKTKAWWGSWPGDAES